MVRFKHRYITIEVSPDKDKGLLLKKWALNNAVVQAVKILYGEYGAAALGSGFYAQYYNPNTKIALIKCRHGPHNFLIRGIPTITEIAGQRVSIKILYIGATIKHCLLNVQRYQRGKLESVWKNLKNHQEKQSMLTSLMASALAMKNALDK